MHCCIPIFIITRPSTTEIYTLSLHDALPIFQMVFQDPYASLNPRWRALDIVAEPIRAFQLAASRPETAARVGELLDRKSTRLNSSHANISYAVFCLKKKN